MKKRLDVIITNPNPVLEEVVIGEMQKNLHDSCGWLNHIFGKAIRQQTKENKRGYYPSILIERGGEYLSLLPDDMLGCFAFFVVDDSQRVESDVRSTKITAPFSCIVWGNVKLVSNASPTLIKERLLKALTMPIKDGKVTINNIYEKSENIYKGFTIEEVKTQHLMHPYFGFRYEGEMTFYTSCV